MNKGKQNTYDAMVEWLSQSWNATPGCNNSKVVAKITHFIIEPMSVLHMMHCPYAPALQPSAFGHSATSIVSSLRPIVMAVCNDNEEFTPHGPWQTLSK